MAEGIATRHGLELKPEPLLEKGQADAALMEKKGRVMGAQKVPVLDGHDAFLVDVAEQTDLIRGFLASTVEKAP